MELACHHFFQEIRKVEEEYKMEYVPIWLRDEREEGIKRGEKRGIMKMAKQTAAKMLKKGFDIDTIIEITGLDKKEIDKLAHGSN